MILVDTSIWVDHLREGNVTLVRLLELGEILVHPFVVGELMLGGVAGEVLAHLRALPAVPIATVVEIETLIKSASLAGRGIGYVDAALVTSTKLHGAARLWTADRRLAATADALAVGYEAAD